MEKILVINCGSSSLKFQLYNVDGEKYEVVSKGIAERIGMVNSVIKIQYGGSPKQEHLMPLPTHSEAIKGVFGFLLNGALKSMDELSAVGHRVAQGGDIFKGSVLIDEKVVADIASLSEIAPLHNPAHVLGIKAVQEVLPNIPQVAVFDTSFHQTMAPEAYLYALPEDQYKRNKIRRYGFHGTSHQYVYEECAKLIGKRGKIITCHLGNGASLAAIDEGKCIDTSMGFTPLAGTIMGTRSGDIDPYIPLYIMKKDGLTADEVNNMLNKQSGMLALCGYSDNRDIESGLLSGNEKCLLATKCYVHSLVKIIGSYIAELGGVDAIVFTAGVGENGVVMRHMVMEKLAFLGIKIDEENNKLHATKVMLSTPDSKVKVFMIPTDEELVIAKDTMRLCGLK
ncbi:MAG: acetate kinase [Alphaproteobacteria bacterium]|nr:acetate kinase [Alphaproteobacteria bacterium]